jgi:LysR family hydrogen peroxide-inducible transcriptional activator
VAYPKLQLIVQEGLTADLCARLADGTLEAALLALPTPLAALARSADCARCEAVVQALPEPLGRDAYELRVLFDEPFRAAVPPDHAVAGQDSVAVADLDDLELLLLADGHCLRGQALEICRHREPQPDDTVDCRATSLETLLHLVAAGRGCTLLPALAACHVDPSRIAIRRLRDGEFRRIGLVWRRTHPRGRELELLAEAMHREAPAGTMPWPSP